MALKIGTAVDTASTLLRNDAFSSAAKNGGARTGGDRATLSRAEQEQFARFGLTYAGADQVREKRGEEVGKKSAPAALVYQTALQNMKEGLGDDVDHDAPVTLEWLDELLGNSADASALMHLAVAESADDPISFKQRLESLRTFFGDNDIDMGGGVWTDTGRVPRDSNASDHVMKLLKSFIGRRERDAEESFDASRFVQSGPGDVAAGIRAAGLCIAADGFGESSHESALHHSTQIASLIKRMGDGVQYYSANARLVGESLQGDTPVVGSVHLFVRPNGNYVAFSSIGGGFSRPWEEPKVGAVVEPPSAGAFPADVRAHVERALTRLPLDKRWDGSEPSGDWKNAPQFSLPPDGDKARTAYLVGGEVYVAEKQSWGEKWWELGAPPPANIKFEPTAFSIAGKRSLPDLVHGKIASRQMWPIDGSALEARLSNPTATDRDHYDHQIKWKAYAHGGHLYVRTEQAQNEWWYAGPIATQTKVDISRGKYEESLKGFVRDNARSDWIFPTLGYGNDGTRCFALSGEAAKLMFDVAATYDGMSQKYRDLAGRINFDPARDRIFAVLSTADEPEVQAMIVHGASGDVEQVGISMNFIDPDFEWLAGKIPVLRDDQDNSSFRAIYELLRKGKEIVLGSAEEGVEQDWSINSYGP